MDDTEGAPARSMPA